MNKKRQAIVNALNEAGYNSRQVTIRTGGGSYSSSFYLTIRDPEVNYHIVKEIAQGKQNYRVCEGSGEILQGGNTFVFVQTSDEVKKTWSSKYFKEVEDALNELLTMESGTCIKVGHGVIGFGTHTRNTIKIWNDLANRYLEYNYSPKGIKEIATDLYLIEQKALVPQF